MRAVRVASILAGLALAVPSSAGVAAQTPGAASPPPPDLQGTAWQLVKFQGGDGTTHTLTRVRAASGAKDGSTSAPKVTFWNKGSSATLSVGAKTYPPCSKL